MMRNYFVAGVCVVFLVSQWVILHRQYIPEKAVETAREFIIALSERRVSRAFDMTSKGALTGATLDDFQRIAERQMLGALGTGSIALIQRTRTSPFQTYGNRLRRQIFFREVEPPHWSVDHVLSLEGAPTGCLPFEVRLTCDSGGIWKVSYFQSHAM